MLLSGVKRATTGSVLISEDAGPCELGLLSPEARARKLAVVEQSVVPAFDFTVFDLVAMGRYPAPPCRRRSRCGGPLGARCGWRRRAVGKAVCAAIGRNGSGCFWRWRWRSSPKCFSSMNRSRISIPNTKWA